MSEHENVDRGTAMAGYQGTAMAGDSGTATAGDSGTATGAERFGRAATEIANAAGEGAK